MVRFLRDTQILLWLDFYMIHHGELEFCSKTPHYNIL